MTMPIEVYAFKNNEDVLYKSSSGGAFWAILEACYGMSENNIVVYGASFGNDFKVMHKAAYTMEECEQFRGSKYVKSDTKNVYKEIEEHLGRGNRVLFSGTPCQVAALKTRLKNKGIDTKNLYSIDLICHGTPKPQVWEDYKRWIESKYKSKISGVSFRDKNSSGAKYSLKLTLRNGKVLVNTLETSIFTRLFLRRLIMEEGCYRCPFANMQRQGDITLGDFWGIENIMPDFPTNGGVSLILVNTDNGKLLIDEIKKNVSNEKTHIEQCFSSEYIKYQNNLQKPADRPDNIEAFKGYYREKGFDCTIKKYAGYGCLDRIKYKVKRLLNRA